MIPLSFVHGFDVMCHFAAAAEAFTTRRAHIGFFAGMRTHMDTHR